MARIALDAMGGDFAPQATVSGALLALGELDAAHTIQLVGQTAIIEAELTRQLDGEHKALASHRPRISIVEAPEVIGADEKPGAAIRGKQNSSMVVGLKLQAGGQSDAFVSAGNTGAQMAASVVVFRLHTGLKRPAIATILPTAKQPIVLLDSGANVDCGPEELTQFAWLGSIYAEDILGRANPVVGLLNIGEEPEKGNVAAKEAHQLLTTSGVNFIGNVEGRDLPVGACDRGPFDVVVCDGFVGNVVLKFYEAIAPAMMGTLVKAGIDQKQLGAALAHLDYSQYGGAPLLGVRGISIISHGKSSPKALKNALKVAVRAVESRMDEHIGRRLQPSEEAAS
ncbi:MAG TPA: phosphate acyltransferase PlsX [Gemmatimonadaceae bacterium]|nr:phosphate acyltransferase PlsX [Gemmatimonadaceae bacterium]